VSPAARSGSASASVNGPIALTFDRAPLVAQSGPQARRSPRHPVSPQLRRRATAATDRGLRAEEQAADGAGLERELHHVWVLAHEGDARPGDLTTLVAALRPMAEADPNGRFVEPWGGARYLFPLGGC
jgi:hypothetical protein